MFALRRVVGQKDGVAAVSGLLQFGRLLMLAGSMFRGAAWAWANGPQQHKREEAAIVTVPPHWLQGIPAHFMNTDEGALLRRELRVVCYQAGPAHFSVAQRARTFWPESRQLIHAFMLVQPQNAQQPRFRVANNIRGTYG
jgi:hypothetical protein